VGLEVHPPACGERQFFSFRLAIFWFCTPLQFEACVFSTGDHDADAGGFADPRRLQIHHGEWHPTAFRHLIPSAKPNVITPDKVKQFARDGRLGAHHRWRWRDTECLQRATAGMDNLARGFDSVVHKIRLSLQQPLPQLDVIPYLRELRRLERELRPSALQTDQVANRPGIFKSIGEPASHRHKISFCGFSVDGPLLLDVVLGIEVRIIDLFHELPLAGARVHLPESCAVELVGGPFFHNRQFDLRFVRRRDCL